MTILQQLNEKLLELPTSKNKLIEAVQRNVAECGWDVKKAEMLIQMLEQLQTRQPHKRINFDGEHICGWEVAFSRVGINFYPKKQQYPDSWEIHLGTYKDGSQYFTNNDIKKLHKYVSESINELNGLAETIQAGISFKFVELRKQSKCWESKCENYVAYIDWEI